MEGTEKPHMDKYKEIMNDWNHGTSCMQTSLLVSDLKNFQCLISVVQCVEKTVYTGWFLITCISIMIVFYSKNQTKKFLYKYCHNHFVSKM
jgi:hypothetical protein